MLKEMRTVAIEFAKHDGWSDQLGLYFHCYPHCSVNALHRHMVDQTEVGPTFRHLRWKNLPLDDVLRVLEHELKREDEKNEAQQRKTLERWSSREAARAAVIVQHL